MLQPDEPTEVVPRRADSGGRWALLAAVGVTSIGIAFLSFFQMPGNASDAGVVTATPAPSNTATTDSSDTWAPLTVSELGPALDDSVLLTLNVKRADIPVAAEGDTPSVLITPTPKARVDTTQAIGWPVTSHLVSSSFGLRSDPLTGTVRFHTGTDFPAPCGLPVFASADGTVSGAGEAGAYGNRVVVNHGQRFGGQFITTYSHLQYIRTFEGQVVKQGDVIGLVGTTGRSTGCHLHFETIIGHQLFDAIPLLLGEGPSSESWPVGYFMPYGSSVTVSGLLSPTPSASSGSPSASSAKPGTPSSTAPGSPASETTTPGATPTSTSPSPGESTPPTTPPASSESPTPSDPPSSTEPSDPPSSSEPTDPPSSTEPPATSEPPPPTSEPPATSDPPPPTSDPPATTDPPASSEPPPPTSEPPADASPSSESTTP